MIKYPDYDRSILSVTSSILEYFGAEHRHHGIRELDEALAENPKKVILMLFDGLGMSILEKHLPEDAFLRKHATPISSVFPPTTVAATTSVQSGLSPIEHGWLGWVLYFREIQDNVIAFTNIRAPSGMSAGEENLSRKYMPYRHICDIISDADSSVTAEAVSMFAENRAKFAPFVCRKAYRIAKKADRCFLYCYWINPDSIIHKHGTDHWLVRHSVRVINRCVERLSRKLDDSVIAVIADHGLTDIETVYLEDYPEIFDMLERMPSIESRAASMFVKDGAKEKFREAFTGTFGDRFMLLSKEEVLDMKLFGDGAPHPKAGEFIGDYISIATDRYALNWKRSRKPLKGHHAGLTAEEMTVPLVICRNSPDQKKNCMQS